jgi:hypothetical protein
VGETSRSTSAKDAAAPPRDVATLEWAADALLRTALHDFKQPQ